MVEHEQFTRGAQAERLARGAAGWLSNHAQTEVHDPSLYHGLAGVVLALHEAHEHFGDSLYGDAVAQGADTLSAHVERLDESSLYFGLTGVAVALRALGRDDAADRGLSRVRDRFDGHRWNRMFELFMGNAGIGLGALRAGDTDLAITAVSPYLTAADPTPCGVNWRVRPTPARSHHIAHGTLGIVYALAAVGHAADREDMIEMALAGARDVVGRNEAGPDGFLVPHSDPPHKPELIDRYSYGWCNGPAGDAQVFRLLAQITGDETWTARGDRCWATICQSGLPRRRRPGFWDNNARCCGTAGVLALACDRVVERGDDFCFANVLVDDLTARATVDEQGVRWSNHEHRATPSELPPRLGWAMGNAGILRELLRYVRLSDGRVGDYVVPWPDHPNPSTFS
ncbi:lanthionine synthetase LanC family protein [Actinopolymorpha sp. NPDC004070]|uniref:lanthionine synthetase LanC family protein n=1 Tax=Actinopolymorpha sp. NPDC004070 TaxID=3154548 RepID=UPI0033B2E89E